MNSHHIFWSCKKRRKDRGKTNTGKLITKTPKMKDFHELYTSCNIECKSKENESRPEQGNCQHRRLYDIQ